MLTNVIRILGALIRHYQPAALGALIKDITKYHAGWHILNAYSLPVLWRLHYSQSDFPIWAGEPKAVICDKVAVLSAPQRQVNYGEVLPRSCLGLRREKYFLLLILRRLMSFYFTTGRLLQSAL